MSGDGPVELPLDALRRLGEAAYVRAGMDEADAALVVDVQLDADLRGVDTHGFQRLPWYVEHLESGRNNPRPDIRVLKETPSSVHLDGDNGVGQLVCVRLMERVIGKALATGLAVGAVRSSNDWGCGAYYPLMAARAGLVAFATTTSVPTLAPFGTRTRALGNNPMVYAFPRRGAEPIVLDMALTPVALGKVLRAMAEGQPIPQSWGFLDADGQPTTDPPTALRGVIPAIGGYKGTGLSLAMNVLAGVLPGSAHSSAVDVGRRGQFMWAVSPDLFAGAGGFAAGIEAMVGEVKAAEPLPGSPGAFLPGEIEAAHAAEARARGTVRYPRSVAEALATLAASLDIELPAAAGAKGGPS